MNTALPREANWLEIGVGAIIALTSSAAVIGPLIVDPSDPGLLGPLVTPVLVALGVSVGALIAGGPRGRSRLASAYFGTNRRYIAARTYVMSYERDNRLVALGRTPAIALVLVVGALACFAKPIIAPHQERYLAPRSESAALGPGLPAITPAMRADLDAAAAAGDPEAIAVLSMLGGGAPSASTFPSFSLDDYTAERNVAWPCAGLALLLAGLWLFLSPGGLSAARPVLGAAS